MSDSVPADPLAAYLVPDDDPIEASEPIQPPAISDEPTPWGTGLTVAGFVAAVTAGAIVVLSVGVSRVHPLLAVALNLIAVGGLAPTLWGWRTVPVLRWFVLGGAAGIGAAWVTLLAIAASHL
jgi:hypothetical protein